jgi:hypothetical protein
VGEFDRSLSETTTNVWPNENEPGYSITWGGGAFHGEYVYVTQTKDARGNVHWGTVALEEAIQKEEQAKAKAREDGERSLYFKTVNDSAIRGLKSKGPVPVQLHAAVTTTEVSNHTTAVTLSLTITNTTTNEITFPNPDLGILQEAFWDIRVEFSRNGQQGNYQVALPSTGTEPKKLVLAPGSAVTRVFNILGAKMVFDDIYSSGRFPGETVEKLNAPGGYQINARLYFKEPGGSERCIFDIQSFEIK